MIKNLLLCMMTTLALTATAIASVDADITTILILDGKAVLVDVDEEGHVTRRYMEVPEYFESNKDHSEKVEAAKKKYEILKKHQIDQIRFIAFDQTFSELNKTAMKHIVDVANHYNQTYANQVIITAARRGDNDKLLNKLVDDISFVLKGYGVAAEDIEVQYKEDKGDLDLQFVKIKSNLR